MRPPENPRYRREHRREDRRDRREYSGERREDRRHRRDDPGDSKDDRSDRREERCYTQEDQNVRRDDPRDRREDRSDGRDYPRDRREDRRVRLEDRSDIRDDRRDRRAEPRDRQREESVMISEITSLGGDALSDAVPEGPGRKEYALIKVLEDDEEIHNHYKQLELLGAGLFGQTFLVEDLKNPKSPRLAMKVQNKKGQWFTIAENPEMDILRLYKEMLILSRILPQHKNIIRVKDLLVSKNFIYIVQELCTSLTLYQFYPVVDNTSGQRVFRQLVDAIHLMHEYGVVHLDLKGDNVLFVDESFMECKIIDFGVSVYNPDWATKFHNHFTPSIWFSKDELEPPSHVTKMNDVESLGLMLYHMMAGGPPSIFCTDPDIEMRTNKRPRLHIFDEKAKDLLEKIGPYPFGPANEADYLTIDQIREHPWLTGGPLTRPFLIYSSEFSLLQNDLTALKVLLKDWEILPIINCIQSDDEVLSQYLITGNVQRCGYFTNLFECEDTANRNFLVMRFLYRVGDLSANITLEESEREPLRIFNELWITLRILPKHENMVEIRDVLVHPDFVVVVREFCGKQTLEDFFVVATDFSARIVFRQLAETVRLMHLYGVVHMDLHCHNVIFMETEFNFNFKIVDFSKAMYSPTLAKCSRDHFHPGKWFTPQLAVSALNASVEVDVRALGRILLAMMTGIWQPGELNPLLVPLTDIFGKDALNLLSRIGPPPFGPGLGEVTLSMDQICAHPWLAAT